MRPVGDYGEVWWCFRSQQAANTDRHRTAGIEHDGRSFRARQSFGHGQGAGLVEHQAEGGFGGVIPIRSTTLRAKSGSFDLEVATSNFPAPSCWALAVAASRVRVSNVVKRAFQSRWRIRVFFCARGRRIFPRISGELIAKGECRAGSTFVKHSGSEYRAGAARLEARRASGWWRGEERHRRDVMEWITVVHAPSHSFSSGCWYPSRFCSFLWRPVRGDQEDGNAGGVVHATLRSSQRRRSASPRRASRDRLNFGWNWRRSRSAEPFLYADQSSGTARATAMRCHASIRFSDPLWQKLPDCLKTQYRSDERSDTGATNCVRMSAMQIDPAG